MKRLHRTWIKFRALPGILQYGAWLALALLIVPAVVKADEEGVKVQVRGICQGGRLVALQLFVPAPGMITIEIPPDACRRQPEA